MSELLRIPFTFLKTLKSKIAFYPSLLLLVGVLLAIGMLTLERSNISLELSKRFPWAFVEHGATALSLLSACITGLISVLVFSFSMVMLLLSQASQNFSPRLLPGLISEKNHQLVLGIFLATIVYNFFVLFSIEPDEDIYQLPGLSILLSVGATIFCIGCFIYFIHSISQRIQISNIIRDIYSTAKQQLTELLEADDFNVENSIRFDDFPENYTFSRPKGGYFQSISTKGLINICKENDCILLILHHKGKYIHPNEAIFSSDIELSDEVVQLIFGNLFFSSNELISENYLYAFKQLTEIAIKAMSPGINDPGTAIISIDYLSDLFAARMQKKDRSIWGVDNQAVLAQKSVSFAQTLYQVMASLRTYASADPSVTQQMMSMLVYLSKQKAADNSYYSSIALEAKTLLESTEEQLANERDFEHVKELYKLIQKPNAKDT